MVYWRPVEKEMIRSLVDDFLPDSYWKDETITPLPLMLEFQQTPKYLVSHHGDTQGPFEREFIEAMVMAQVYPASVLIQKVGETEWVQFSKLGSSSPNPALAERPTQDSSSPTRGNSGTTKPKKTKPETIVAWVVGSFGVIVVLWIIGLVTSSKPPRKNNTPVTSYQSPTPANYTPPSEPRSQTAPQSLTPPLRQPVDDTQIYRDSSGRTYRVPNAAYSRLLSMKSALSIKQSRLNSEQSQLEALANQLDRDRIYLDQTSQYAVDAFNRKVNQVNTLNSRVQALVDDFNRDVDSFNSELERVGTPIY